MGPKCHDGFLETVEQETFVDKIYEKFVTVEVREVYLRILPNFKIFSFNGVDITWSIWNDNFIPYYNEIMIYINNKNSNHFEK